MSLDEKRENIDWRERAFENELENKYEIIIQNGMTCIHGNELNKTDEWNLLHDIINTVKRTKKLNRH